MREKVGFTASAKGPGGLLVTPEQEGPRPAVVLLPAIAGVNDYVTRQAARLSDAGYACVVLDYYARQGGTAPDLDTPEKVLAAVAALSDTGVLEDVAAAVTWLRRQSFAEPNRIGVLGFCIGGTYALLAGTQPLELQCAVAFYGMLRYSQLSANKPVSPLDMVGETTCPVLGHFGEEDRFVPLSDVADLATALAGRPAEIYTYPGAGHAFHEDFRPSIYRPVAAAAAWARTNEYLSWYLRGKHEDWARPLVP